jgi:hypothetical protein
MRATAKSGGSGARELNGWITVEDGRVATDQIGLAIAKKS